MLLKLMRKDLILHWRGIVPLLVTAIGLLIYAVLRDGSDLDPAFLLIMLALVAGFGPLVIAAREDKLKTRALTCSLPVERTTAVGARYLESWILFVAYVALMAVLFLLLRGPSVLPQLFTPQTVFGMLTAFTLAMALMMPLVERFGFTGMFVILIGLQVLGLLVVASSFVIPGRSWIGVAIDALKRFTAESRGRLGPRGYYALFAAILVALNAASFGVSAALFRRREL